MTELLRTENISYSYYGRIAALDRVSLAIGEGELLAVIGSNGSGKSTLLQVMAGLLFPHEGGVFLKGDAVNESRLRDAAFRLRFRNSVGYVFQDSDVQLFCPTVMDELVYGPLQSGVAQKEAIERAHGVMSMLGIEELKDRPSYMMSGGEKKKLAIGSVLTMNPDIILLDEPANGLDPKTQCFLVELFLTLKDAGKTLIIATHDLSLVAEVEADVAVLTEDHRIAKTGRAEDILRDEELLLNVNLIHEHRHRHAELTHSHLHAHYLYHKH